jgi:hypothetical protein
LKGQPDSTSQIWVNNSIRNDFGWALQFLDNSLGVCLLKSISWSVCDATTIIFCDACPDGMGFWYPETKKGFVSPMPSNISPKLIFYFEALCVLSALHDTHNRSQSRNECIIIYTNNLNTVDISNSFQALPTYNHLLKAAVDILTSGQHDLHVLHVPGTNNGVADALSRSQISSALTLVPDLSVCPF